MTGRAAGALGAVAVVSVVTGWALGEYEFAGPMPWVAGVLFGLAVSELLLEVGRLRSPLVGGLGAAMVAAALWWAGWLASDRGLRPFPALAWAAMVLAAGIVAVRTSGMLGGDGRARDGSTPDPGSGRASDRVGIADDPTAGPGDDVGPAS